MKTKLTLIVNGKKMPLAGLHFGTALIFSGGNGFIPATRRGTDSSSGATQHLFLDPSEKQLELYTLLKESQIQAFSRSSADKSNVKFTIVLDSMAGKKTPTALSGTYDFDGVVSLIDPTPFNGNQMVRITIDVKKVSAFEVSANLVQ